MKSFGLKAPEVHKAMDGGSVDTVRKLGTAQISDEMLDKIEAGIEAARRKKLRALQAS